MDLLDSATSLVASLLMREYFSLASDIRTTAAFIKQGLKRSPEEILVEKSFS